MKDNIQIKRRIGSVLPCVDERGLVMLTGARQTGKTTTAELFYRGLPYFNLDAIEFREQLEDVSSFAWAKTVGNAVFDEVQKAPQLLDKIKFAYDAGAIRMSVLLGSAQILLLKNVRESLAGRVFMFELFPLMLGELVAGSQSEPGVTLFERLLDAQDVGDVLSEEASVRVGEEPDRVMAHERYLMTWGGMPGLLPLTDQRRRQWLKSYEATYLERDLGDLARLDDLKPFRRFQKLAALRSGQLLSFSELARDAGVAVETARRYMEYLRVSYQSFLLQPFHENLTSQVVKTPKIFWHDCGLLRSLSGLTPDAPVDGHLFETYVAAELMKLVRTLSLDAQCFYYRTRSGAEVDFLVQTPRGILTMEVKNRRDVTVRDIRSMKPLAIALGARWMGGMVLYRGTSIKPLTPGFWGVPTWRLFGGVDRMHPISPQ